MQVGLDSKASAIEPFAVMRKDPADCPWCPCTATGLVFPFLDALAPGLLRLKAAWPGQAPKVVGTCVVDVSDAKQREATPFLCSNPKRGLKSRWTPQSALDFENVWPQKTQKTQEPFLETKNQAGRSGVPSAGCQKPLF